MLHPMFHAHARAPEAWVMGGVERTYEAWLILCKCRSRDPDCCYRGLSALAGGTQGVVLTAITWRG